MIQLKVASMFFFSGLAVVIALVVIVYTVAWIYDRASGSAEALLTPTELQERRVASTLVKEAGLAGLLPDEKNKVMRHFFQENATAYAKHLHDIETPRDRLKADRDGAKSQESRTNDETTSSASNGSTKVDTSKIADSKNENPAKTNERSSNKRKCKKHDAESNCCCNCDKGDRIVSERQNDNCTKGPNCSIGCEDSNDLDQASKSEKSITRKGKTSGASDKDRKAERDEEGNEVGSPEDDAENDAKDGVCPICLVEFENDESVIIGDSCGHMFHFECFLQWVEKNHTDCPLCRSDMMTAENFLASAYEVLGEQRVNKLKHINEEAARRLAALEANRRDGAGEESSSSHDEQSSSEPRDPPARPPPIATADTSRLTIVMVQ